MRKNINQYIIQEKDINKKNYRVAMPTEEHEANSEKFSYIIPWYAAYIPWNYIIIPYYKYYVKKKYIKYIHVFFFLKQKQFIHILWKIIYFRKRIYK